MNKNPIEVLKKEAPEVSKAFDELIQKMIQIKELDKKPNILFI